MNAEDAKEEVIADEKPAENGTHKDEKPAENGDVKNGDDKKDGDEESGDESEEELGSLEKPVEILTTKRERKSSDFFHLKESAPEREVLEPDFSQGKGTAFGEIPYINWKITNADTEDLAVLHKLLYKKPGKHHLIKKNIRSFCGYPFEANSKQYSYVNNIAYRLVLPGLKWISGLMGLDTSSKDKDELRTALLDFLMEPKDLGHTVPEKKTPAKKKSKTPSKKKKDKTPKSKSKAPKDEQSGSDVSEASDSEESDADEEKEKEEKKKKKPEKSPKKKEKKAKAFPVKIAVPSKKKSAQKKRKADASDGSDEDEPLVKKKKSPPTSDVIKKDVAEILKDADLEQVTMKTVVKQVYDKYPSFDLTSKKDFIKSCVKELIS